MPSVRCSSSCFASVALAAALGAACAGTRAGALRGTSLPNGPLALLPLVNLSGASIPVQDIQGAVEAALRGRGVLLVSGEPVDAFLALHRMRYTGGIDRDSARAMGAELGVSGVLITTVETYDAGSPPRAGMVMRLVSADDTAQIRWIAESARAGDDAPGPFDIGIVRDYPTLQADVLNNISASLALYLGGKGPSATACPGGGRFGPKALFRSPLLDAGRIASVAVLPFVNETQWRNAGDLIALQFVRQLEASGRFHAVEPGVLRDELLRFRIVMEGGVALDSARIVLDLVQADLVLAGYVREYEDAAGPGAAPRLQITALLLERKNNEVVWESTSYSQGDAGVFFFDAGLVRTMPGLACRMVASAVAAMVGPGGAER